MGPTVSHFLNYRLPSSPKRRQVLVADFFFNPIISSQEKPAAAVAGVRFGYQVRSPALRKA